MQATISLILTGTLFSALWASAFVAGKLAMAACDPISLLCGRFAIAGLVMVVWAVAWEGREKIMRRELLIHSVVLGALNNALYLGLSFAGLAKLSPEATVLIVSTAPFFTTALSIGMGGPRSLAQLVGAIVGFCGVYIVLSARMRGGGEDMAGLVLVFLGTMSFSLGTVFYRMRATHHNAVALNGLQNLAGALMLLPFAPNPVAPFRAISDPTFVLAFLHLIVAVSIIDFLIWLALVRRIGAAHAARFHLLNPVFGVMLSAAVFGTAILSTDLIGTAIVIAGLVIVAWDTVTRASSRVAVTTLNKTD